MSFKTENFYEDVNNAAIIDYNFTNEEGHMESLVAESANKSHSKCGHDANDFLQDPLSSEIYETDGHLFQGDNVHKEKTQETDKIFINDLYASVDPHGSLFLDSNKCRTNNDKDEVMAHSMNLNMASVQFEANGSTTEINAFGFPSSSSNTDSEVALTLASLGNLKTCKNEAFSIANSEVVSLHTPSTTKNMFPTHSQFHNTLNENINIEVNTSDNLGMECFETEISSNSFMQNIDANIVTTNSLHQINDAANHQVNPAIENININMENNLNCSNRLAMKVSKESRKQKSLNNSSVAVENCESRKENLLNQLLKASELCAPASLIPEGVVDDVIPAVGYRIMDMSNLNEIIKMMHNCPNAPSGSIFIQERASLRQGAVSQLSVICTGCLGGAVCETSAKENTLYDINARVEKLQKKFEIGETQVQKMLEILGIFYRPSEKETLQESQSPKKKSNVTPKTPKTSEKKERNIECKKCQKKFTSTCYLTRHMSIHNSKIHTCPYCQAYFQKVFNLKEHIKKHENKRYECDKCGKSYSDRSTLLAHVNSFHLEIRKMECEFCSKKFYNKSHFVEHLRSHSGEKRYECDVCGKRYSHLNSIKKHKETYCNNVKYKCRLCGKCFRWLFGIHQHLFQQHKLKKCDIDSQVIVAETTTSVSTPHSVSNPIKNDTYDLPSLAAFSKIKANSVVKTAKGKLKENEISPFSSSGSSSTTDNLITNENLNSQDNFCVR